jgi:hypothetical protein
VHRRGEELVGVLGTVALQRGAYVGTAFGRLLGADACLGRLVPRGLERRADSCPVGLRPGQHLRRGDVLGLGTGEFGPGAFLRRGQRRPGRRIAPR